MMGNRNILAIVVATILGIFAVFLANRYLTGVEEQQEAAAEQGRMVQIAVARVPLEYGATLSAENVRLVSWPSTSVPAGAFRSLKGLYGASEPRVVLRPIESGEPILPGKITGFGGRASLSELIETDMRAVAVRINDVAGVAGFIIPGDRVDVLVTREPKLDGEVGVAEAITDVILQNVRVVAVDQKPSEKDTKPAVAKTVTLSVDQEGAQKLALGGQVGTLSLALRNAANQDQFMTSTVGTRNLGPGNRSSSIYAGEAKAPSGNFNVNPFATGPIAQTRTIGPSDKLMTARPKPKNSVSVEIVRGTASSSYDVSRHRGY